VHADNIQPSSLELTATSLISLDRANDVSSDHRAVLIDSIKIRVESEHGVSA